MKNKLELIIKSIVTTAIIALCIIVFSSCTNTKHISKQRIIIDSLGIHEVLPQQKGLRK